MGFMALALLLAATDAQATPRIAIGPGIAVTHGSRPTPAQPSGGPDQPQSPVTPDVATALPANRPAFSVAVLGNRLVNGNDQTVALHGVNISGTEWECLNGRVFRGPSDDTGIAAIAAWHANAVRIPLNEDCWLGINGVVDGGAFYRAAIGEYVGRLHAHGLYAILDLHWNAPGSAQARSGQAMADADHAPEFWSAVASYFKEDPAVLFDLYNEPSGISWSCWRDGCAEPGFQTAGMQALVDAVRATGATQPVMVGGLEAASLAGKPWLENRPSDPRGQMVASVHVYNQDNVARFNKNIGTVAARFPVVVGEVGEMDCGHHDLDAFLPWADSQGVSYTAWAWYVGDCAGYPSLISDYGGTPTSFGAGYRDHLVSTFPVAPQPGSVGALSRRALHAKRPS